MRTRITIIVLALLGISTGLLQACGTVVKLSPGKMETERVVFSVQMTEWGGGTTKTVTIFVNDKARKEAPTIKAGVGLYEGGKEQFGCGLRVEKDTKPFRSWVS